MRYSLTTTYVNCAVTSSPMFIAQRNGNRMWALVTYFRFGVGVVTWIDKITNAHPSSRDKKGQYKSLLVHCISVHKICFFVSFTSFTPTYAGSKSNSFSFSGCWSKAQTHPFSLYSRAICRIHPYYFYHFFLVGIRLTEDTRNARRTRGGSHKSRW